MIFWKIVTGESRGVELDAVGRWDISRIFGKLQWGWGMVMGVSAQIKSNFW
ncbi:MAG: hypothetical protein RLZZ458_2662 [Planctomycetota bacterium]